MSSRIEEIARLADAILQAGERREVLDLIALTAGRFALAKLRAHELQEQTALPARDLTVKEATAAYPISRAFIYERGEALGFAHRTEHGRIIVIESKLREYLEGHAR